MALWAAKPELYGASNGVAITTGDTSAANFAEGLCRGIYVGVGGDVAVVFQSGAFTFKNVPSGSILPVQAIRVNTTNTTATNMGALY